MLVPHGASELAPYNIPHGANELAPYNIPHGASPASLKLRRLFDKLAPYSAGM